MTSGELPPLGRCVSGKRGWPEQQQAEDALPPRRRRDAKPLYAYYCTSCGWWHHTKSKHKPWMARRDRRKGCY